MKAGAKTTFSNRRTYNGRLTIGRSKKAYHWWNSNIGRPTIGWFLNSKQEGLRWWNSDIRRPTIGWIQNSIVLTQKLEFLNKKAEIYIPFIFATSGDVTAPRPCSASNTNGAVPIYYYCLYISYKYIYPVSLCVMIFFV